MSNLVLYSSLNLVSLFVEVFTFRASCSSSLTGLGRSADSIDFTPESSIRIKLSATSVVWSLKSEEIVMRYDFTVSIGVYNKKYCRVAIYSRCTGAPRENNSLHHDTILG